MLTEAEVLAALPSDGWLCDYLRWSMKRTDAHVLFHILSGLTALTASAPISLNCFSGATQNAALYGLLVGESGVAHKGSAIAAAQEMLMLGYSQAVGCSPGSQEALFTDLSARPRQIVFYPEFGNFLASTHGYMEPLKTRYTELWDSVFLGRSLVKKKTQIKNPRLSLLGGISPPYLEAHATPEDWHGGFLSRFLVFYARPERSLPRTWSDTVEASRLCTILRDLGDIRDAGPYCGEESAETREFWDGWLAAVQDEITSVNDTNRGCRRIIGSLGSRAEPLMLRVAMLLAWSRRAEELKSAWSFEFVEIRAAIHLVNCHILSFCRIGDELLLENDWMRRRKQVLLLIRGGHHDFAEILRRVPFPKRKLEEVIDHLLTEGEIEKQSAGRSLGKGASYKPKIAVANAPSIDLDEDEA